MLAHKRQKRLKRREKKVADKGKKVHRKAFAKKVQGIVAQKEADKTATTNDNGYKD